MKKPILFECRAQKMIAEGLILDGFSCEDFYSNPPCISLVHLAIEVGGLKKLFEHAFHRFGVELWNDHRRSYFSINDDRDDHPVVINFHLICPHEAPPFFSPQRAIAEFPNAKYTAPAKHHLAFFYNRTILI